MVKIGKRIQITGGKFRIQSPKNIPVSAFMFVWILLWSFAGVSSFGLLFKTSLNIIPLLLMVIWFLMWFLSELLSLLFFLWCAFGEELVYIRGRDLIIKTSVFGLGPADKYHISEINNLRINYEMENFNTPGFFVSPLRWISNIKIYDSSGGNISFDYKGKRKKFGNSLEEKDATQLVEIMKTTLGISGPSQSH